MNEPNPEQEGMPPVSDRLRTIAEGLGFKDSKDMGRIRNEIIHEQDKAKRQSLFFDWAESAYDVLETQRNSKPRDTLNFGFNISHIALLEETGEHDDAIKRLVSIEKEARQNGLGHLSTQLTTILIADFDHIPKDEDTIEL